MLDLDPIRACLVEFHASLEYVVIAERLAGDDSLGRIELADPTTMLAAIRRVLQDNAIPGGRYRVRLYGPKGQHLRSLTVSLPDAGPASAPAVPRGAEVSVDRVPDLVAASYERLFNGFVIPLLERQEKQADTQTRALRERAERAEGSEKDLIAQISSGNLGNRELEVANAAARNKVLEKGLGTLGDLAAVGALAFSPLPPELRDPKLAGLLANPELRELLGDESVRSLLGDPTTLKYLVTDVLPRIKAAQRQAQKESA